MHRKQKFFAVSAAITAMLLAVAGCGSSSHKATSTTVSSTTGSGGAPTGSPIKIGVLCSCSGPFGAPVASAYTVIQDWSKSVNASGGLDGHPVDLDFKDDASNPGTSATNATAIVSDHVAAIIDLDILDEVWEKTVDSAKIPVVGGNISSPLYATDSNFYSSGQTNDSVIYSALATAKRAGATNMALMYCAESPSCAESVPEERTTGAALGVPVVYAASISATAPNYTAQCLAAKQAGSTAVFLADSTAVNDRVASDCSQQGYDPIYITEGTGYQDLVLTTPGMKDKLWLSFPMLPYFSTDPAVQAMNSALDKYSPGLRHNAQTWSEFGSEAWAAGLLLQAAAKNADLASVSSVTAADFTRGLNMISNDTLGGFSPALTFTAGKPHPIDCWYTARVVGGVPKQLGGQTCHSPTT